MFIEKYLILFNIDKSLKLENIDSCQNVLEKLINPLEYLNYPKYELNNSEKEKVSHGNSIKIDFNKGIVVLTENNVIVAIANVENQIAKVSKVFI